MLEWQERGGNPHIDFSLFSGYFSFEEKIGEVTICILKTGKRNET